MRSVGPSSPDRRELVLGQLCGQAREMAVPELDVAAIEARVLARVTRSQTDSLVVQRGRTHHYFALAAALAAAVALLAWGSHWSRTNRIASVVTEPGRRVQSPTIDGTLLGTGQILEAMTEDLIVTHPGIATWRLAAPARARILENGSRPSVALDSGRIEAEVVPHAQPEVFSVEVEHVRVAVHGTVFSVQRVGDEAEVVVKEGVVSVGSGTHPDPTNVRLLAAPARLRVAIRSNDEHAGAGDEKPLDNRSRLAPKAAPSNNTKLSPPIAESRQDPETTVPQHPLPQEVERIWELAAKDISDCFASQVDGDPNVRVSFMTQVNLRIAPDGQVSLSGFNPPVPQPFLGCAEQRVVRLRTQPSTEGSVISRAKMLTR